MNKTIKNRWLKALESGEYKQGKGRLCDNNDNFCVLGVLCNLYANSKKGVNTGFIDENIAGFLYDDGSLYFEDSNENIHEAYPPDEILKWAKLEDSIWYLDKLAEMNDSGQSFKQIAKYIRKKL